VDDQGAAHSHARSHNPRLGGRQSDCDADRQHLAMMDNDRYRRDIIDDANRGNASFYMIDPRGWG
jgi:hypothetical protein